MILAKNPEEVHAHVQLAFTAANEVKKQIRSLCNRALQSDIKAIALIEADKKPASMDAANWASHKPLLPQRLSPGGNSESGRGELKRGEHEATKATALNPNDPTAFALLGMVINNDYLKMATKL